eukprot:2446881-Pleurochrysis_carterae.AAC.2
MAAWERRRALRELSVLFEFETETGRAGFYGRRACVAARTRTPTRASVVSLAQALDCEDDGAASAKLKETIRTLLSAKLGRHEEAAQYA